MCPAAARLLFEHGSLIAHCLLVETAAGLVLVDTGYGLQDCTDRWRVPPAARSLLRPSLAPAETAISQVQQLGYAPRDVRHIVVTHLDVDHAGGLADFPWATVHVHAEEYRAAVRGPSLRERARYAIRQLAHGITWQRYAEAGERWYGLDAVRPLVGLGDELALVPLIGHTRGHSGVAVRDGNRWLLHAGDAFFSAPTLEATSQPGRLLRAFERVDSWDNTARKANLERLRQLHRQHRDEVDIICAHDPSYLHRMRHS